jgi:phytoene dehydrogenase-like protein
VIVVGGGHNGLACAAYLAKAGRDVLVLERRDVLGGAAVTEPMWDGYRISSAAYVVSLLPERIVAELDLKAFGYRVSLVSPDYFVPFPDGTSLTFWGDLRRDVQNIARLNKHDAEAYVAFDRYFAHVGELMRRLLFVVPPNMRMTDLLSWARTSARLRGWTGRDIHELVRLFTMSAADLLDEWFEDPRVKGALATQAVVGAWAGPMTPGSAYVLMHHWIGQVDGHVGAWGWVDGGMGGVSDAIAGAARAAGAGGGGGGGRRPPPPPPPPASWWARRVVRSASSWRTARCSALPRSCPASTRRRPTWISSAGSISRPT